MFVIFFALIFAALHNEVSSTALVKPASSAWIEERKYPSSCYEALAKPAESNIYLIQLDNYGPNPFVVACERGGWTVIQRRINGKVDFYRGWHDYKFGFGDLTGEFWIGLDKLHAITNNELQELLIVMEDFDGETRIARYDLFAIGDENEGYALKLLGKYTGSAGDSLDYHRSYKFTTHDKNHGPMKDNCAVSCTGAWWYNSCHHSNLNGQYLKGQQNKLAISWHTWRGHYYSLKSTQMMIKPKI